VGDFRRDKEKVTGSVLKRFARLRIATASTVAEYAIIGAIVSIAGVILLTAIGKNTTALLDRMNTNFPK
jgi:hypothetical protein